MESPKIALLGGPNSGKTHFAGQLYGRLQRSSGGLTLRREQGAPTDLSLLSEVLRCLEEGNAASHTSSSTWDTVFLPIIGGDGRCFDLHWPDYGGEQLKQVFKERSVDETWRRQLENADGWVILIRLKSEVTFSDALSRLQNGNSEDCPDRNAAWDANAYWVEKLQILLHVANVSLVRGIKKPRLAVLLSCYDEVLTGDEAPPEVLKRELPLLSAFLNSNWEKDSLSIWGLSSLGQTLNERSNSEQFIDNGPETQGWVVRPEGGERSSDLSLPLTWVLKGIN